MRKFWRWFAIVLIGASALAGLSQMADGFGDSDTTLQQTVEFGVALYGVLGLFGTIGMIRRRPWAVTIAAAWGVAVTYVATVASFAYHDPGLQKPGTTIAAAATAVACAFIAWFVVWAARESARPVILQR